MPFRRIFQALKVSSRVTYSLAKMLNQPRVSTRPTTSSKLCHMGSSSDLDMTSKHAKPSASKEAAPAMAGRGPAWRSWRSSHRQNR